MASESIVKLLCDNACFDKAELIHIKNEDTYKKMSALLSTKDIYEKIYRHQCVNQTRWEYVYNTIRNTSEFASRQRWYNYFIKQNVDVTEFARCVKMWLQNIQEKKILRFTGLPGTGKSSLANMLSKPFLLGYFTTTSPTPTDFQWQDCVQKSMIVMDEIFKHYRGGVDWGSLSTDVVTY